MELNELNTEHEHASFNLKALLLVFAVILVGALGYLVYQQNHSGADVGGDTIIPAGKTASKASSQATTANTYQSDYGFSLTFNDTWTGYKVKTFTPDDNSAVAYLYFNLPTTSTESTWATESQSNYAGYASVFAVSVFTPDQYAALAGTPGQGTKLAQNDKYVFSYSHAQSVPTDLMNAFDDVATVIATFKLN